jgi:fibronectin type 3 domain-containing protein
MNRETGKGENKKLLSIPHTRFTVSSLIFSMILIPLFIACGRRGDPVAILPYQEIPAVNDLQAAKEDGSIRLTWSLPEEKDFPQKALKGFVIFRAEIPQGTTMEDCKCDYRLLDFIETDSQIKQAPTKKFEYVDTKIRVENSHAYKVVVMDKRNKMSTDSNLVIIKGPPSESEKSAAPPPSAPTGLIALYTQESVVLTWDEVRDQEIKFYKVHRSEGNTFIIIGEVTTPVFTDKNVEPSRKYFYKVTAVGDTEGSPSEIIEIATETK